MELTRRQAIQTGATALAAFPLAGCKLFSKHDDHALPGDIDAHSHVWSDDLARYPLGSWATKADMQPPTFTAEQLLAIMKPNGVDRAVLIQHAPLHGYDNSYILDCARKYPGVFSVVAMINERAPHLRERLADLRDQGARGIRIGPTIHADRTLNEDPPNWLKAQGMQLLWKHSAELDVAICPLVSPEFLPSLDPMCAQHPETTLVLDHFGRIEMNNHDHARWLTALAKYPRVHVKASAFRNFGDKQAPYEDLIPLIRMVLDAFGPDRVMWGTDCPYQLNDGNNYADSINLIRNGIEGLSDTERRLILRDTAVRVFFG